MKPLALRVAAEDIDERTETAADAIGDDCGVEGRGNSERKCMMNDIKIGNSEVRLDPDGEVDEIVIRDRDGVCLFHLEYMADNLVWSALYSTSNADDSVHVNFSSRGKIKGNAEDMREPHPEVSKGSA